MAYRNVTGIQPYTWLVPWLLQVREQQQILSAEEELNRWQANCFDVASDSVSQWTKSLDDGNDSHPGRPIEDDLVLIRRNVCLVYVIHFPVTSSGKNWTMWMNEKKQSPRRWKAHTFFMKNLDNFSFGALRQRNEDHCGNNVPRTLVNS